MNRRLVSGIVVAFVELFLFMLFNHVIIKDVSFALALALTVT